jgi:hypothetical protein
MDYPDGFEDLVKLAKKMPVKKSIGNEIWEKYCDILLMGKDRYEPEIRFLRAMLKQYLDYDFVKKTNEFGWHDQMEEFLKQRTQKIRDEYTKEILNGVLRDLSFLASSIKAGVNFFEKKEIIKNLDKLTAKKADTENFIKELVALPGLGYSKSIMWLHSVGRATDFAPPTRYLKTFLNSDVGPYYQYYEDEDYFMKKAQEMAKDFPKTNLIHIYRAIVFYRTFKSAMPRGSKFTPNKLLGFLKKKKLSLEKLQDILADMEYRNKILEEACQY